MSPDRRTFVPPEFDKLAKNNLRNLTRRLDRHPGEFAFFISTKPTDPLWHSSRVFDRQFMIGLLGDNAVPHIDYYGVTMIPVLSGGVSLGSGGFAERPILSFLPDELRGLNEVRFTTIASKVGRQRDILDWRRHDTRDAIDYQWPEQPDVPYVRFQAVVGNDALLKFVHREWPPYLDRSGETWLNPRGLLRFFRNLVQYPGAKNPAALRDYYRQLYEIVPAQLGRLEYEVRVLRAEKRRLKALGWDQESASEVHRLQYAEATNDRLWAERELRLWEEAI